MEADGDQALSQLEGDECRGALDAATPLARRCAELWRVPLADYSYEDLRVMIRQGFGLGHLVPRALAILALDPMASGDTYRGDLLHALGRVPLAFWVTHPELRGRFERLGRRVERAAGRAVGPASRP